MKAFKLFLLIIFLLIIVNCKKQKKNNNQLVVFDLINPSQTSIVKLSELGINDIQYIPLETASNSLIQKISKIKIVNNSIFLCDYNCKVSQFKLDGSFINLVGTLGKGPSEYLCATDLAIDTQHQSIYICSIGENKLYNYSFSGEFIKSIPCPYITRKIHYLDKSIFCYSLNMGNNAENVFNIISNDGTLIKSFPNKYNYRNTKFRGGFLEEFLLYTFNGGLYAKEIYSDTVFVLKNNEFEPAYVIDHGGKTISVEAREEINNFETFLKTSKRYSQEINLFEFGNFIYSEFKYDEKGFGFIGSWDKSSRFLIDLDYGFINDIDGGSNVWFKTTKDDDTIISWIDAFKLKAYVASEAFKNSNPKYPEKKKELEKLANSLDENDNPVLMLVKLKGKK
jgi:hypothetical protein